MFAHGPASRRLKPRLEGLRPQSPPSRTVEAAYSKANKRMISARWLWEPWRRVPRLVQDEGGMPYATTTRAMGARWMGDGGAGALRAAGGMWSERAGQ